MRKTGAGSLYQEQRNESRSQFSLPCLLQPPQWPRMCGSVPPGRSSGKGIENPHFTPPGSQTSGAARMPHSDHPPNVYRPKLQPAAGCGGFLSTLWFRRCGVLFCSVFISHTHSMRKFPDQGSNSRHSSDRSRSSDNAGFSTTLCRGFSRTAHLAELSCWEILGGSEGTSLNPLRSAYIIPNLSRCLLPAAS